MQELGNDPIQEAIGAIEKQHEEDKQGKHSLHLLRARSSQCSTTGVTKAVVCIILSVG